jgi:ATP-dependent helicase/nuclease subunit B
VLLLAPLVQAWKKRLPAHVASLMEEEIVVPASAADAIWLARDLAELIDEVETEGATGTRSPAWCRPNSPAGGRSRSNSWRSCASHWPQYLAEAASPIRPPTATARCAPSREAEGVASVRPRHRRRLDRHHSGHRRTARSVIARLPRGAVVLPGLDAGIDEESWQAIGRIDVSPSSFGHPQTALKRLLERLGIDRERGDRRRQAEAPRSRRAASSSPRRCVRPRPPTAGRNPLGARERRSKPAPSTA